MAISLAASTGGVSLLPLHAQNFLPPTVVSRCLQGGSPMTDLSLGYLEINTARPLKVLISKIEDLKFGAFKGG